MAGFTGPDTANLRRVKVTIEATMGPGAGFDLLLERLNALVDDPAFALKILRAAVAETLLVAYRQRFIAAIPKMTHLELADGGRNPQRLSLALRTRLEKAYSRLADAQYMDDRAAVKDAERRVARLQESLSKKLDRPLDKKNSGPQQSLLSRVLREIMVLLTEVNSLGMEWTADSRTVGIGPLGALNEIETPSRTKGGTSSPYTILWRQLEFGAGVYSTDPEGNPGTAFSDASGDGSWWYGKMAGKGRHIIGQHPAHVIFDASGVPYTGDALRFEREFARALNTALAS